MKVCGEPKGTDAALRTNVHLCISIAIFVWIDAFGRIAITIG